MQAKLGTKLLNTFQSPKKDPNSVTLEGELSFSMAAVAFGATSNDRGLITFPRYSIFFVE